MQPSHQFRHHLATLDIVRVAAAAAVVAYHLLHRGAIGGEYLSVTFETGTLAGLGVRHLYLGVHLFFAVSGFVIMASVDGRGWRDFALARLVRLWPTYALCVTLTALALAAFGDARFPVDGAGWLANLSFVAPLFGHPFMDGVYWSIVVELVFYAWVAVALAAGVLPGRVLAFAGLWLAIAAVNELALDAGWLRDVLATRFAPWFAFGILMHEALRRGTSAPLALLLIGAIALSMHNVADEQIELATRYGLPVDVPGTIVVNAGLLLAFLAALHWRAALRPRPWLVTAGLLTYPLYLLHQNIGYVALERLAPLIGRGAASFAALAGLGVAAWAITRWFDPPARRAVRALGSALARARPAHRAVEPATQIRTR